MPKHPSDGEEIVHKKQRHEQNRRSSFSLIRTSDGEEIVNHRREAANSNERRRMQSINLGFQELKDTIPITNKMSKASILHHAAMYMRELQEMSKMLLHENHELKRRLGGHGGGATEAITSISETISKTISRFNGTTENISDPASSNAETEHAESSSREVFNDSLASGTTPSSVSSKPTSPIHTIMLSGDDYGSCGNVYFSSGGTTPSVDDEFDPIESLSPTKITTPPSSIDSPLLHPGSHTAIFSIELDVLHRPHDSFFSTGEDECDSRQTTKCLEHMNQQ